MMYTKQIKETVKRIMNMNPNGFTFNPYKNSLMKSGYVVASLDTQDCIGEAGLYKVVKYCLSHRDYCIGDWKNEDGTMQFDASKVFDDIEEAIMNAIENEQRAIFNLYTKQVIMASEYNNYLSFGIAA